MSLCAKRYKTVSAESKSLANIKYINIKMKKKLKNNSEILFMIKDAGELCVKILLFLLCCQSLEKIDFEFMKSSVMPEDTGSDESDIIIGAVDFWKEQGVLDYEIVPVPNPNPKGANMHNIINIILNISRDINMLDDGEPGDADEFARGLGIYKGKESVPVILETADTIKTVGRDAPGATSLHEISDSQPNADQIHGAPEASRPTPASKSPGAVSIDELSESLETNDAFRKLIHEAQVIMQTIFNTSELSIIYNLYENQKMETGLILKLVEINVADNKNNLRYIEKDALGNAADGILTLEQFEEKMRETYKLIEFENKIIKMFNAESRKFKPKERNYIKSWAKEFDFSDDMLMEGYNRCLKQIEKLSIDYINTIYINWHRKGFRSIDEVNGEFGAVPDGLNVASAKKNAGYNINQFYEKLVKKSNEDLANF